MSDVQFDDGSKKPQKPQYTEHAIPMDGAAPPPPATKTGSVPQSSQYGGEYPEAEVHYQDIDAPPAEGTPLYPDAPADAPELSRFKLQGFKDIWATIVFGVFLLFSIVCSIVMIAVKGVPTNNDGSPLDDAVTRLGVGWVAVMCIITMAVSMVTASVMIFLSQLFPVALIYTAHILCIVWMFANMLFAFIELDNIATGILLIFYIILHALWLFMVRKRIPFSAALLKASARVVNRYKFLFAINFGLSILTIGYVTLWGYGMAAPIDYYYNGGHNAGYGVIIGLMVFTLLWVMQVVPNMLHVTAAGLVATWYYAGIERMPRNPTWASFKRASTTSFGSICFGSLLVAILEFLRFLAESSRNNDGNNFLRCIAVCLLRCLEDMVRYFNHYAFVHVAIYGCGYIEGAKRTFRLIQQCFFAAYFNDCLIVPTLNMFTFTISLFFGFIAGISTSSWAVGVLVFCSAAIVHALFFSPVASSVTTIFVCFAEAPTALQQSDPTLYAEIQALDGGATHNSAPAPAQP